MEFCLVTHDGAGAGAEEPPSQRSRACTSCARLKMKCQWPSSGAGRSESSCSRCSRMKLDCQVPESRQRKKRGKGTRVAQLEKKIDGIVSLLAASQRKGLSPLTPESPQECHAHQQTLVAEESVTTDMAMDHGGASIEVGDDVPKDFSEMELFPGFRMSHEEAMKRFDVYRRDYSPQFGFVPIPDSMSSHELYAESRILYWTILATVSPLQDKVQLEFKAWFRRYLAEHVIIRQEKSIDILQAILVFLAWNDYHFYGELQVTNIVHLALALVVDLRLDRPAGAILAGPRSLLGDAWSSMGKPIGKAKTDQTLQEKRTVLGVYHITALLSSFFKKCSPLQWTNHLAQCCDSLTGTCEYESDMYIVALVKMQHLADRALSIMPPIDCLDRSGPIFQAPIAMAMDNICSELERFSKFQPDVVRQHNGFWAHYHSLIVRIYEPIIMMKTASVSTSELPLSEPVQRSAHLWKCLEAVADFHAHHLSIPAAEISALPVPINCVLAFCTVTASRLALHDNSPDWDTGMARRRLNLLEVLKGMSDQYEEADKQALNLDRRRRVMEDGSSVFLKCGFKVRWIRQWYASKVPQEQQMEQPQTMEEPSRVMAPTPDWATSFQFDDEFWVDLMSGYDVEALDAAMANVAPVQ
ncbi:hypothetical protein FZEAL_8351 [Fusarium zealandicum]|uniref:Zn(2)-C6 fungal-type domain-containing protein n=1 Tax=Fusarium zealandicum TaxID=1053134 RepID=A0A8H4XHS0_9HYPO|nr:hypothetical protein FZEAL_8351 [Fusarium zealandicum]